MQHFNYATLKKLHFSPDLSYIKQFVRANIKLLFTYPKSVWYSQRYNSGEKFILMDTNNYPYYYNFVQSQKELADPLNISLYLLTATNESYILGYPNLKPNTFSQKTMDKVSQKFLENFQSLNNLINIRLEDQEKFDLPVAVFARILYASNIANGNSEAKQSGKNMINEEAYRLCLGKFLEKIEFADAEAISMVMFSLSNFGVFEETVWKTLIDAMNNKNFVPEFTIVTNKTPHVFRYEEIDAKSIKSQYLDDFGNKLFLNGYLAVFQAYSSIIKAHEKGVNCGDIITNLQNKFPELKDEVDKFNTSI